MGGFSLYFTHVCSSIVRVTKPGLSVVNCKKHFYDRRAFRFPRNHGDSSRAAEFAIPTSSSLCRKNTKLISTVELYKQKVYKTIMQLWKKNSFVCEHSSEKHRGHSCATQENKNNFSSTSDVNSDCKNKVLNLLKESFMNKLWYLKINKQDFITKLIQIVKWPEKSARTSSRLWNVILRVFSIQKFSCEIREYNKKNLLFGRKQKRDL